MADHPSRPVSVEDPRQLGFVRQSKMVPWLSPRQLLRTALQVVVSKQFGSYSDKREIEANLAELPPPPYDDTDELWFDYVADLGDAFEPTYTIASLLARPQLGLAMPGGSPIDTPRGRVLVMGGDEVYPVASVRCYENQTTGPYRAALPYVATESDAPHLYAIPGNHDWYDGLTAFMRVFCRAQWIGGWKTQQTRSYFALKLPNRWWLWAIDVQFDSYVDEPQYRYFADTVGKQVRRGDSVILCTPTPSWVHANQEEGAEAYATVDYLERTVIRERCNAEVRLTLTGDAHHYARYVQTDGTAQKLTAGGGGAFLAATHHLPEELELPPAASRDPGKSQPPTRWRLQQTYPTKAESRKLRWMVLRLPLENRGMWVLISAVYLLYAWMMVSASRSGSRRFADVAQSLSFVDLLRGMRSPLTVVVTVVLAFGLAGFTKSHVLPKRWGLGLLHLVAHLVAVWVTVGLAAGIAGHWIGLSGHAFDVVFLALVGVGGGLLGSEVLAAYLLVADRFGLNANELFSAQRNRDWKNFLRLHIGEDGVLTVYPVAVRRTPRRWKRRHGGNDDDPWLDSADGPVVAHLIEQPIRVEPATPAAAPPPVPAAATSKRRKRA